MTKARDTDALDERYLQFCHTEGQRDAIKAVIQHGGLAPAARALGKDIANFCKMIRAIQFRASIGGLAPGHDLNHAVAPGFLAKGHSTLRDRNGAVVLQWEKTKADDVAREAAIRAAAEALAAELPRLDPIEAPGRTSAALCNVYTLTDCHVGMLARWADGQDWDLAAAESVLVGCFEQMILTAPRARVCVVNQLGDFLHFDGLSPVTPTSGHVLDAAASFRNMYQAAVRILRRIVDVALMRHEQVHLVIAEGNHDLATSLCLQTLFSALYEREPRLTVNESELPYYAHQHGKTMLVFHHGHMKKLDDLPSMVPAMFPAMYGATTHRYAHAGHMHHLHEKEHAGLIVLQHPTLAAADAYSRRHGYIAQRAATAITYHDVHGEVARATVRPEMLELP